MKINDIQRTAPIQAYQRVGAQLPREERERKSRQDQIEISSEAKRLAASAIGSNAQEASGGTAGASHTTGADEAVGRSLPNASDASHRARLEALRQSIQAGTYRVNAKAVAEKLVNEWFWQ
jgi:flagellar biosynthesis anti-sigma factor FlgM